MTHPGYVLASAWDNRDALFTPPTESLPGNHGFAYYRPRDARNVIPGWFGDAISPPSLQGLSVELAVVGLLVLGAAILGHPNRAWLVGLCALASTGPHALVVWHGDVAEVTRHSLLLQALLHLSLVMLLCFTLDALSWRKVASEAAQRLGLTRSRHHSTRSSSTVRAVLEMLPPFATPPTRSC